MISTMKKFLLLFACSSALAADPRGVLVSSTHVLTYPTDFFTVNSNLIVAALGGAIASGDVVGPGSATAGGIALFSGTTGKLLSSSTLTEANILTESEASSLYAPLASPALSGNPTAPTASPGDSDTSIATTAFVANSFAPLASPALTGDPTVPTASPGDNDTSAASTAFVTAAVGAVSGALPGGGTAGARLLYDGSAAAWESDGMVALVDHFVGGSATGAFGQHGWALTQSGSGVAGMNAGDTNAPGTLFLSTSTSSTGNPSMLTYSGAFLFGNATYVTRFRFQMPTALADGSETYEVRIGFQDSVSSSMPVDSAMFIYRTNSPNWFTYNTSNTSSVNATDTGVPVTASGWYIGQIAVTGTNAVYTMNGTSVTNSVNLPLGAGRTTGLGAYVLKKNGTTARIALVDWWKTWIKLDATPNP